VLRLDSARMPPPTFLQHTLSSFDATNLAYYTVNGVDEPELGRRPMIVLANGLGGTHSAWRHQVSFLRDRYRFVTWDYRGLFSSGRPRDPHAFSMDHQVRDLFAILDREEVEEAILVGWSMGVQVCLEAVRRRPSLARGLVLINGTFGHPFATLPGGPIAATLVPQAISVLRRFHGVAGDALRRVVGWPETIGWLKRIGFVGSELDEEVFADVVAAFSSMDLDAYFRTLNALGEHDANDVLPQIQVPTLVITGERDLMTPRRTAEKIASKIPGAELTVVRGGTHYTAVEFPELVNLRIDRFFRAKGL
jgi:pimeloyl-ACP methyl ester carboxylesterase